MATLHFHIPCSTVWCIVFCRAQFWNCQLWERQLPIHWLAATHIEWYPCQRNKTTHTSNPKVLRPDGKLLECNKWKWKINIGKKLVYDILAAQKCSFLVRLTYFATIFVPGDGFLRQSGTNPIFGAVVGSSLLAFPTAPWSTQPAVVRWDAFKTAREPVLGSANPRFFFVADRKKKL